MHGPVEATTRALYDALRPDGPTFEDANETGFAVAHHWHSSEAMRITTDALLRNLERHGYVLAQIPNRRWHDCE